jgi:glycine cleavage system regulatory protein
VLPAASTRATGTMSAIIRLAKSRPFAFGMGYSLLKTSGCDLMVQKVVEKREKIDWRRNAAFGSFGLLYLGGVQYMLYVPVFSRLFPNAAAFAAKTVAEKLKDFKGIRDLFSQVFLDQMVHHPLMYFPVFYMIKDFVTSDSPNPVRAVNEYAGNVKEDLIALWKVWIPSTFLNFAFMPMWARIPWVASTSLIWTCILSAMRGSSDVPASNVFVGVDHETMELVTRTVVGPAPRLDPSRAHVLLVVRGPDRPGIISEMTQRMYEHGATITTSKMLSLGDEFAIMCHASVDKQNLGELTSAISGGLSKSKTRLRNSVSGLNTYVDEADGLQISLRVITPPSAAPTQPLFTAKLWLTGPDKPGLLYHLADVCAQQGLNIEHLQTEQHTEVSHGTHLFSAHCHVCSDTVTPDVALLRKMLHELEAQLECKCSLEVVQR